jgi:ribosomal protein S18 acetylase RimI-like enzyme
VSALVVRPARPDEADVVGALTEAAYAGDGHLDHPGGDAYGAVLRDATARVEEATVLVAERDGAVIGTVTVAPAGTPWANVARPGEIEVRMLAVHGGARRQGVAEALMAVAEDHARTRGLGTVVLSTDFDMIPAQRLYERLGYTRRPDRDWRIDIDLWVYAKTLSTRPL